MIEFAFLIMGVLYGFLFGIIPVAGTTTALVTLFGFMSYFQHDPYLLVIFTTAVAASSSIGDSFASVVLNIPGGGGAAATMVDGFPMARKGQGARALSAAVVTSTTNGVIWGLLVFMFLPFYAPVVNAFAIPEMFAFTCMAMIAVVFVNSKYWVRGFIALGIGVFLGLVGLNPETGAERFTGGWYYLADGIQLIPIMAGFLAFPELIEALFSRAETTKIEKKDIWRQIWQGFGDSWVHRWDGLRGGAIGGVIGLLPGVGGNIVDWLAYGQTVALNKNEKIPFGSGNVKGLIGTEGANNAQKATAYVPTVLFGVPGAPFEAVVMGLFMYVGLEMGTPTVLADTRFFWSLSYGFLWGMLITFLISILFIRYAINIMRIPFAYYCVPLIALIVWTCGEYTGGWEDYAMVALCTVGGLIFKYCKLSRAAFIIGFVLAERIESTGNQYFALYDPTDLLFRPISLSIVVVGVLIALYGIFGKRVEVNYV